MTVQVVEAEDATSRNEAFVPSNLLAAGYDTGSPDILWSQMQYASRTLPYPAIHIDQDPRASDPTADILDVEAFAATIDEIVGWIGRARADFLSGARPGQRWPGIYLSMNNLTPAVDALMAAGIINVPFWTAQPGIGLAAATQRVATATGNYPCIGVQYEWDTVVDKDVFSLDWVTKVSTTVPPPPVLPGIGTASIKIDLVRVPGTTPVYWWNGSQLWHVTDPAMLKFLRNAGILNTVQSVTNAQLAAMGPVVN